MLREILNYDGVYSVSSKGYVINNKTGRILKPDRFTRRAKTGEKRVYYRITLSKNNVQTRFALHRLVAEPFIDNPDGLPEVNHLDGDRSNNDISNLEWSTGEDNVKHAMETGLCPRGESHGNNKYSEAQALQVISMSKSGCSRAVCAESAGVTISFVKDIRGGRAWKHLPR